MRVILIVGFLVVGAVVLIAANTSAMGVRERIPEIAILKSLGFRRRPILAALLAESTLQGLLGGLLGAGWRLWRSWKRCAAPERPACAGILGPLGGFRMSPASRRRGRRRRARRRHSSPGIVPAWNGARIERRRGAAATLLRPPWPSRSATTSATCSCAAGPAPSPRAASRWWSSRPCCSRRWSAGCSRCWSPAGEPDNLVVMRKGATNDGSSVVPRDAAQAMRIADGIARDADGAPLVSPELVNQPFMRTARRRARERARARRRAGRVRGAPPRAARRGPHVHARTSARSWSASASHGATRRAARQADRVRAPALDGRRHLRLRRHVVRQRDLGRRDRRAGRHAARGILGRCALTIAPGADRRSARCGASRTTAASRSRRSPRSTYYAEQAETANALYVLVLALAAVMGDGRDVRRAQHDVRRGGQPDAGDRHAARARLLARRHPRCRSSPSRCCSPLAGLVAGVALALLAILAVNTLLSGVAFSMMTFTVATVLLSPSIGRRAARRRASPRVIGVLGGLGPAWRAAASARRRRAPARLMADRARRAAREPRRRCASSATARRRGRGAGCRWVAARRRRCSRSRAWSGEAHRRRPRADGAGRGRRRVTPPGAKRRRARALGRRLRRQRGPLHLDRRRASRAASTATSSRRAIARARPATRWSSSTSATTARRSSARRRTSRLAQAEAALAKEQARARGTLRAARASCRRRSSTSARAEADTADARVGTARGRARSRPRVALEYTTLRAPRSGVILAKLKEVGEIAVPGGFSGSGDLIRMANLDDLRGQVDVTEAELAKIRIGPARRGRLPTPIRTAATPPTS